MISHFSNVLIVDDNPLLLSVLSEIFVECGFAVRTADNGFRALTEIARRTPDLLLSDLNMPKMSGYELLSIVRRRFPAVSVIAMSGSHSGPDIPWGLAADAFYAKGATSIAHLLALVSAIKNGTSLLQSRTATPVWLPELPYKSCEETLLVTCPECLRPSSHPSAQKAVSKQKTCPHCFELFDLILVTTPPEMDCTQILMPAFPKEAAAFSL